MHAIRKLSIYRRFASLAGGTLRLSTPPTAKPESSRKMPPASHASILSF